MAAYLIADYQEVMDPDALAEYRKGAGATIAAHGGRVLAGSPGEAIEGDWEPSRIVLIEFESMAALKAWYNSPEYQAVVSIRHRAARENLIFVDGV